MHSQPPGPKGHWFAGSLPDARRDLLGFWMRRADILSTLVEGRHEDGSCMTDREIRDEVSGLLIAGYDTAALTLTWTLYLLSQHPEVEEKALAEILAVCGGRRPSKSDLPALKYTHSVITESRRLYPPAYVMGREATCDVDVGSYRIPKGSQLFMTPWVVHRDPRFYDEPEAFRPERWLEPVAAPRPRFAYFPFGGGQHKCIGAQFGMMEVALILAVILPRVRLSRPASQQVTPLPEVFLQPANGLRMHVALREAATLN